MPLQGRSLTEKTHNLLSYKITWNSPLHVNVDTKTTGTIGMWIRSETSDIHFTSFILASTDSAGATSIQTTEAQLLENLRKSYSSRCVERKRRGSLCVHTLCCHHTAVGRLVFTRCLRSLSGHFMNHPQGVGLSDGFRTREGVQQKGGVQTAVVWRNTTLHCCLLGGVIFPDKSSKAGPQLFLWRCRSCVLFFSQAARVTTYVVHYVSFLTSHLSVGLFNPWNELLVFIQRLQTYEVCWELSWWAISFRLQHRVISSALHISSSDAYTIHELVFHDEDVEKVDKHHRHVPQPQTARTQLLCAGISAPFLLGACLPTNNLGQTHIPGRRNLSASVMLPEVQVGSMSLFWLSPLRLGYCVH